jgi:hypothetical protein
MALVTKFEHLSMTANQVHGQTDCTYSTFEEDGKRYLQIDTYGSERRKISGKKSQTVQFDEQSANALKKLLEETFG